MNNELVKKLTNVESELIRLKTSKRFSSINTYESSSFQVETDKTYRVTFAEYSQPILAVCGLIKSGGAVFANIQVVVEDDDHLRVILTTVFTPESVTLNIVSNRPVTNVESV